MICNTPPIVWNIAGSDSFGAAGAQNDLKTIAMHNCHGCQVITSVTSQSPTQCLSTYIIPAVEVAAQLAALSQGPAPKAVKIGMIGSKSNLGAIRTALSSVSAPVVLDPVIHASSGTSLAGDIGPQDYFDLCKRSSVFLTPNIPEAEALTAAPIRTATDITRAAKIILEKGATQVLIKGGHFGDANSEFSIDFYSDRTGLMFYVKSPRKRVDLRGTGCTLASALASNLAQGHEPADAVILAKAYLNQCFSTHARFASPANSSAAIIEHAPLTFSPENFPEVELGEELSDEVYEKSPGHRTGFYVIVDSSNWVNNLIEWEVPTLQLRVKDLTGESLYSEIEKSVGLARDTGTSLYINDHWRQAIDLKAFGVHLGQEDLARADILAIKRARLRLGISTHSWFEAAVAHRYKPSYIALGPVFPTTCKSMRFGPQGFAKLKQWKDSWPYPVVAIGGLKVEHAQELNKCGVDGVAVISDITKAEDPRRQAEAWIATLNGRDQA